ncbi:MAG TPA: hypothetical protein VK796_05285 [Cytophaga sp.]|jgi:hypothetical protein|nr:hypothetical protein [Cytophaga sp.]
MPKDKNARSQKDVGKGSLNEAKTNEDFNKKKPDKNDPELNIKNIKK